MTITTPGATADLASAVLPQLERSVTGILYTPEDAEWDRVRSPWALAIDQTPVAVLEIADVADVQAAVRWAVEHGFQVTAQPGGHGASDTLDQVLLLRTRGLRSIEVDTPGRRARIGAGVKAGELLVALEGTGMTFLSGSNPDVTVVGMTLTGGMSWFGRAYGIAANSVISATLVDGVGRLVTVSATQQPELFWAIRGGGGDFGIVVSLEIALHPAPAIYGGRLLWPVEQMPAVLSAFREVTASAPEELTVWYHTYQFPPTPDVPEPIRGRAFAGVAVAYLGDPVQGEALLRPLRAVPGMVMDLMGPVPISQLGTIGAEPVDPMPSLEHSMFLADLSDETLDALASVAGAGSGSPLAILQIRHLGGAFTRSRAGDGAAAALTEPYLLFAMGVPVMPELAAAIAATFPRLATALGDHTNGRTVPNFLGPRGDLDRVFTPEIRRRLAAAKRAYDPLSIIRSNRPVLPKH